MKITADMPISYIYDATRKGAKFSINDGDSWMNGGELAEVVAKAIHGLDPLKDHHTRFNEGSDIPEFNASVKSSKASLTNKRLADNFNDSVNAYFAQVASSEFWYVSIVDEIVTIYKMGTATFERFVRRFGKLNERGVIRLAKTNATMLAWLDYNNR